MSKRTEDQDPQVQLRSRDIGCRTGIPRASHKSRPGSGMDYILVEFFKCGLLTNATRFFFGLADFLPSAKKNSM